VRKRVGPSRWPLWVLALAASFFILLSTAQAQGAKQIGAEVSISDPDPDHVRERNEWFYRGRVVRGMPSAELRRRAYQAKLQLRAQRATALPHANPAVSFSAGSWLPLGPVPLASDASGNGTQDYHQVAGRATAVAIDPADSTGNTVYIGGAQSGIWKSTNAANAVANNVVWTPITDNQATLSIGAIAIQPGNNDPSGSLILAATGEANNSGDSYFGLGILRSADGGNSWSLISTANSGTLSFTGLGGTRMAFGTANGQTSTAVVAMAASSEGLVDGAITGATRRGLYTSLDAGQSWTYNALSDPGGATDPTSATAVVYNDGAGKFFAAVRYHGYYSSPDGVTWTRLASQPGGAVLSAAACPPQSVSNNYGCPIYRGEIATVSGLNEMYAWYVYSSSSGDVVDGGIWRSVNGGASWISISNGGIANCGDSYGCGVQQGTYNLELLAMPDGGATDLYAGAINLYKCQISSLNPTCTSSPFINLTHVYGCIPVAAPSHVHPDQHALAAMIPTSGSDSGNALLYFANDGGIYRALDGFHGLVSGSCSGINQFDDLNQKLGSMAQLVSFSQHPSDPNTMLAGAQDNGSPATSQATTNSSWTNVLGGDGGYNAIDPIMSSNFYASNPDIPPEGLGIQLCSNGVYCNNAGFNYVVTSNGLDGDDGAFYFPYILDPGSAAAMLVGTCRVWRGPRTGGVFSAVSPNFDTLGAATCTGSEVNQLRGLAAAGNIDSNGSGTIYATTTGLGPVEGPAHSPAGGRVWVTTNASAGAATFVDVTENGPQGNINPNQYPVSGVAIDASDASGNSAYITVMGFTGGAGHVWKTTNAGVSWSDFTGNLPDSPANAVVVYAPMSQVFVATDVGVFATPVAAPNWIELGPNPSANQAGFLPNVAVTALGVFNRGGQQLLRASTYGRGMWQFNLVITPDFQFSVSNSPLTALVGQTASFNGAMTAVNGYTSSVTLSCTAGSTAPPSTCTPSPASFTPGNKTPFTVAVGGAAGDYSFNLQATGADTNHLAHTIPLTLHLLNFGITTPSPTSVTVSHGSTSSPVNFKITAAGSFSQSVTVACTTASIPSATCNLTPGATVNPKSGSPVNMTASVEVPGETAAGTYLVTLQATTSGAAAPLTTSFNLVVTANPDFVMSEPSGFPAVNAGSTGVNGPISIASQDGFSGTVTVTCPATYGAGSCSISPASVSTFPATVTLTINGSFFAAGTYTLSISATSGSVVHSLSVPFTIGDYSISDTQTLSANPGEQTKANLQLTSSFSYGGKINATCDASSLPGAMCTLTPANPLTLASGGTTSLTATINIPNDANASQYNIKVNTQDTTGTPSHSASILLTIAQGFLVTSSTSSQTVTAGQTSGAYALRVLPVGSSFNGAVSLACSAGLPAGAQCVFNPSTPVTPGNSAVDVVMNISTTARVSHSMPVKGNFLPPAMWMPLAAIVFGVSVSGSRNARKIRQLSGCVVFCLMMMAFVSCAGVSGGGGGGQPPPPATYHITVTGTSSGTPPDAGQSITVTLVVN
jgi:hypothetical protein